MSDLINSGNKKDKWTKRVTDLLNWLNAKKQATLVAGENVTLTPQQDDTVKIDVGESGKVDDVLMNGNSIVQDKVASFNNYVELTQAEYDALPDSKYSDGVLYCIKDSGIDAHDRFCPIIYSYNEREVGVWLDGKPLYQKTVHIDTLNDSTQTYQYVQYQHGIANIDNIANYEGRIFWKQIDNHQVHINDRLSLFQGDNGTRDITNAFRIINGNFGSSISIEVNRDVIMVSCGTDRTALSLDCTIWYTKTTDVAGSGTWGTDGIPMHHYSKSEHIVGTWIDGKTLFEKTLIATSTDVSGTDVNIDVASLNIDTCVEIFGTFDRITGGGNKRTYMFNAYESSEYWSFVRYMNTEQRVVFKIAMSIGQSTTKQTITIRYTKTT